MQTQHAYDEAFNNIADIIFDPTLNRTAQLAYNDQRLAAVKRAVQFRPDFLTVQIPMPAEVQALPATRPTSRVVDNVIISGAITDGENKKINFKRDRENADRFVASEGGSNAQISLEAIAGNSSESKGVSQIQEFYPFIMRKNDRLSISVYKPVATQASDRVTVCFTGNTLISKARVDEFLTPEMLRMILSEIDLRVAPEDRYASCPVKFTGAGAAKTARTNTPKFDEPRLITGFRTTVKHAMMNISFKKEGNFALENFPIWALAAEAGNTTETWRMLKVPIFLEPEQQLFFDLVNSIDGTTYAEDGDIEVRAPTV
jgi:hypothetical protein